MPGNFGTAVQWGIVFALATGVFILIRTLIRQSIEMPILLLPVLTGLTVFASVAFLAPWIKTRSSSGGPGDRRVAIWTGLVFSVLFYVLLAR